MPVSIGIDLAWTRKNLSAIAVLSEELALLDFNFALGDEEIVEFIEAFEDGKKIVCIDAPLIFPKEPESFRSCENLMRERGIRILPVQQGFYLKKFGCLRGPELVKVLEKKGYVLSVARSERQIIEVYPHATWKRLLKTVPKYKNLATERKVKALEVLKDRLQSFGVKGIGKVVLEQENAADLIDALVCALVGIWHWEGKATVVGNEKEGFIVY
ncbi:MAG: DUF429 domain-containing protein [Thermoplasmata archaeon]